MKKFGTSEKSHATPLLEREGNRVVVVIEARYEKLRNTLGRTPQLFIPSWERVVKWWRGIEGSKW